MGRHSRLSWGEPGSGLEHAFKLRVRAYSRQTAPLCDPGLPFTILYPSSYRCAARDVAAYAVYVSARFVHDLYAFGGQAACRDYLHFVEASHIKPPANLAHTSLGVTPPRSRGCRAVCRRAYRRELRRPASSLPPRP